MSGRKTERRLSNRNVPKRKNSGKSIEYLYETGFSLISQAKEAEKKDNLTSALSYYEKGCEAFITALEVEHIETKKQTVMKHVEGFMEHMKHIRDLIALKSAPTPSERKGEPSRDHNGKSIEMYHGAECMWDEAVRHDQNGQITTAIRMYRQSVTAFLDTIEYADKHGLCNEVSEKKAQLQGKAEGILARITQLKQITGASVNDSSQGHLTPEEVKVLRDTSRINGILCFPFLDNDVKAEFSSTTPFMDPTPIELSKKQHDHLDSWVRGSKLPGAQMIKKVCPHTITQTIITDCSFVASLAVTSDYERRFKKPLITSIIYPQNSRGEPVLNPFGKYMVKLHLNGIDRKVVIDDRLPVSSSGGFLCSFTTNPGELWVSLIEKAFLKVMGGYNFPGSNGGIDLHILTGWIPERVSTSSKDFNKERTWERMMHAYQFGDCLVTCSTSQLSASESERLGLVTNHAYAVLQVKQAGSIRLLQLKNPWAKVRWRGKFSPSDTESWTPGLRAALDYTEEQQQKADDGVFWIDYDSLLEHYGAVYLNWNPELFAYRCTVHGTWPRKLGPKVDTLNREFCPQYYLTVTNNKPSGSESVWILLSKHVTAKKDEEDEYITVHVYPNTEPGRVYYGDNPLLRGTYINNPHYLTTLEVPQGKHTYKILISQYEKNYDLSYTLHAFCTSKLSLRPVPYPYVFREKISSSWTAQTAGGSPNNRETYLNNPQFEITIPKPTGLQIKLEGPRDFSINATLFRVCRRNLQTGKMEPGGRLTSLYAVDGNTAVEKLADTGAYRPGFAYVNLKSADLVYGTDKKNHPTNPPDDHIVDRFPMKLTIVVSAFRPDRIGPFNLHVGATKTAVRVAAL